MLFEKNTYGTRCEAMILSIIWSSETDLSLSEIRERVCKKWDVDWQPQTISTYLCRLVKKGILTSYRKSRVFCYRPVVSKEEHQKLFLQQAIYYYFDGDADQVQKCLEEIKIQ